MGQIPIVPGFSHLTIDISDVPCVIISVFFGIGFGVAAEFIKNLFHLFSSITFGIGELANFICGAALVIATPLFYNKMSKLNCQKTHIIIANILSLMVVVFAGVFGNIILYPLYAGIIGAPINKEIITTYLFSVSILNVIKYGLSLMLVYIVLNKTKGQLHKN